MSRRRIETEGGEAVLLPGRKTKLCACGQPATRYCDFPKYQKGHQYLYQQEAGGEQVLCAEPLCDRCAVEQPNGKDFCCRHADQVKSMIESANTYEPEQPEGDGLTDVEEVIRTSNASIRNCKACDQALVEGKGFCTEHEETVRRILEKIKNGNG